MAQIQVAFYKGRSRLFNRSVSWWTRGPYSHCELIFRRDIQGMAACWSASAMDGGVRAKLIDLKPEHWDVLTFEVTDAFAEKALDWFYQHKGAKYDFFGLLGFVWGASPDDAARFFCSEAIAAALGFPEPWRFSPNDLYAMLTGEFFPAAIEGGLNVAR